VKVTWPDKTFIALTYDKKRDWVLSYTDRDKCMETYGYEFSQEDPKNHYWATVKKTCGKEVTSEAKHEFWYKLTAGGEPYLERIASNVNGAVTDITYHSVFGKPVIIIRGKEKFAFEYFPNGLVKSKVSGTTRQYFTYDEKIKKVASVQIENVNEKGKVVQKRKTEFRYDNKNNLVFAQNTDGLKITMTYDPRGRIATITDQAHKMVKVDYEEKFGKPSVVSRPGLGSINVSYKASGEIDKVNSTEGPAIAMQVANTFNNLLDVISPATAELYN
jgi:YD repeat-containing protein